ncbi:MarR family winged helix-turn-helix transcriptional regulator [Opitutus terrae]|uniref:Transcriptional regulator, MarR family n=1 Tax=Opitutus terrae (strain DSM 11246 / JCM 15787 / PB90-1) TaxID=452637 RepID=B1ZWU2_OPITP|nr:MarR family transcriptional regulator [Opitutus terrae]ACB74219.1 transcriptional regulator, MarR family [Opitutus terrae PB90-1]
MDRETLAFQTLLAVARQRDGLDESRCRLVLELLSTARQVRATLQAEMAKLAITEVKLGILVALFILDPAPATPADLAAHTSGTRSAVTEALDQLAAAGLVQRERDTGDRRVIHVHLTPKGRGAADEAIGRFLARIGEIARDVDLASEEPVLAACAQLNAGAMRISPSR